MAGRTAKAINEAADQADVFAANLSRVADAGEKLLKSGLTMRGLIVLLRDSTGLPHREIRSVLEALPELRKYVTKRT